VTVVGYRTSEFPGFHYAGTGIPVPARFDDVDGIVTTWHAQRDLGHTGAVLVVQPPPPEAALARDTVESAIESAITAARETGIRGPATTPWLLSELGRATGGRTVHVNLALLEANARLAAELSVRLSQRDNS
jgi:pseudouridine-5'-phosphate glycosidase